MVRALSVLLALAAAAAASPEEDGLRRENARLRDEIAALKAGDPGAARRKAIDDYLAGHPPEQMDRYGTTAPYYQGGFVLATEDGQHLLRLNVLNQFGWRWVRDTSTSNGQTQARFHYQALRLRLSGHGFSHRLQFFFDLEFGPNAERFQSDADTLAEGWIRYRRIPWQHVRLVAGRLRPRFTPAENTDDMALAFVARGLVAEFFTVGRTNGLGIVVENLRGARSALQLTFSNGSERFDPDQALVGDDKRAAGSFHWARTIVGEGHPWDHTAYEGDPYASAAGVVVVGVGVHFETNDTPGTFETRFLQAAIDVTWRRNGNYVAVHAFVRSNDAGGTPTLADDEEDYGVQVTASRFVVPRRMEVAVRAGWLGYARFNDPGGDLWEVAVAWSYYWKHENDRIQGHRLRVTLDLGWAEKVILQSGWTSWPAGHVRGLMFRSQVTILF